MIEVITILTKEMIAKLTKYNLIRSKWPIIICPAVLLVLGILLLILKSNIWLALTAICLSVAVPLILVGLNYLMTNMLYKNGFLQEREPYMKFVFNHNNFELEQNIGGLVTTNILNYSNILRCVETKELFYLYVNKHYAYMVDKKGFIRGKLFELTDLLEHSCKKYKKVR